MSRCVICGEEKKELNSEGVCLDCACSIISNDDIPPNL